MKKIVLVLLFAFSLFAGESEEIGVPIIDANLSDIDSTFLVADGKSLYVVKNNVVHHYGLEPLRELEHFNINMKPFVQINISPDNKFMTLFDNEKLQLLSLPEHKLINDIKIKIVSLLFYKDKIVTIDKNSLVTIFDAKTLQKHKEVKIQNPCVFHDNTYNPNIYHGEDECFISSKMNLFVSGKYYIYYGDSSNIVALLNTETLEIEKVYFHAPGKLFITYDRKYLFPIGGGNTHLVDLETGDEVENIYANNYRQYMYTLRASTPNATSSSLSSNSLFLLSSGGGYMGNGDGTYRMRPFFAKLFNITNGTTLNERLIMVTKSGGLILSKRKTFVGTKSILKDIKMRLPNDKLVPLNDATFKKYNQPLNIKAN